METRAKHKAGQQLHASRGARRRFFFSPPHAWKAREWQTQAETPDSPFFPKEKLFRGDGQTDPPHRPSPEDGGDWTRAINRGRRGGGAEKKPQNRRTNKKKKTKNNHHERATTSFICLFSSSPSRPGWKSPEAPAASVGGNGPNRWRGGCRPAPPPLTHPRRRLRDALGAIATQPPSPSHPRPLPSALHPPRTHLAPSQRVWGASAEPGRVLPTASRHRHGRRRWGDDGE